MPPVRFGPFELHVRSGDLLRHGTRIHLPEQAFQILLMLPDHPGQEFSGRKFASGSGPVKL